MVYSLASTWICLISLQKYGKDVIGNSLIIHSSGTGLRSVFILLQYGFIVHHIRYMVKADPTE